MNSIVGPTWFSIYIVGVLPLVLALVLVFSYHHTGRWERLLVIPCPERAFWLIVSIAVLGGLTGFAFLAYNRPVETLWDTYYARALNIVGYRVFGYVFVLSLLAVLWRRWERHDIVRWLFLLTSAIVAGTVFVLFGGPKYKEPLSTIAVVILGVSISGLPPRDHSPHSAPLPARSPT
jgi:hypothetical protein